jgi:hypothetical protein
LHSRLPIPSPFDELLFQVLSALKGFWALFHVSQLDEGVVNVYVPRGIEGMGIEVDGISMVMVVELVRLMR